VFIKYHLIYTITIYTVHFSSVVWAQGSLNTFIVQLNAVLVYVFILNSNVMHYLHLHSIIWNLNNFNFIIKLYVPWESNP